MLARHKRNKDYIIKLKEQSGCKDCGVKYPYYILEFDHLVARNGSPTTIAELSSKFGLKELKKLVARCDIVCANCHNARGHRRIIKKTPTLPT